jgi:rod shape-determining protein MreD
VRIAALVALLVVVQVTVFPHLRLFGAVPDLGLLVALAVAYRDGPEAALVTGFGAGLAVDLFLVTPVGLSALTYSLTAYSAAALQSGVLRTPRGFAPLAGGLGGLVNGAAFVALAALVGTDITFNEHTMRLIGATALYDAVLAPFVFALVRFVVGTAPEPVRTWWAR